MHGDVQQRGKEMIIPKHYTGICMEEMSKTMDPITKTLALPNSNHIVSNKVFYGTIKVK
jgi:hypothetical protein